MTFTDAFDRLMGNEGGYVFNLKDPGGETNWGISKRSYPNVDIKNLTRVQARDIYYQDFWCAIDGDHRPFGVAFQLFDFAVNSSIQTAIRKYQMALGVADDGHFGSISVGAALAMSETDQIMRVLSERLKFMALCSGWPTFGKGWALRIAKDLYYGAIDS